MKKKIFPISQPSITDLEIKYVTDAVKSGWVSSLGYYVEELEKQFAKFCEVKYCVLTNNGTTGLHLALETLGIKNSDEVIIPDLTFIATANAVTYIGAKPVMVDIDSKTLCIDPSKIESAITDKTKAIIPVHLYGHPANMDEINEIAKRHNLVVIEDAAEAHGAKYKDRVVGGLADCGVFSFYGNKIITTGEGGAITTNNLKIYERAKFLRDHAMSKSKRYFHTEIGYNYRMTNLQAALGLAQLKRIDEIISSRIYIFNNYKKYIKTSQTVRLNYNASWAESVHWLVCLEVDDLDFDKREIFMKKLKEKGIDTRPYFYPVSSMPMYQKTFKNEVTYKKTSIGINIPTYFGLTEDDIEIISQIINIEIKNI
jgi:perosamine synthetase